MWSKLLNRLLSKRGKQLFPNLGSKYEMIYSQKVGAKLSAR